MKNQLLKKVGSVMVPVMVGVITIGTLAFADETNVSTSKIKSEGNIDFENGTVVFKAEDLTNLEKEINTLESEYKQYTLNGLNSIGTYFDSNGEPYYAKVTDRETAKTTQPIATGLSFAQLQKGIDNSQYVADEGEQATLDGNLLFYKDETAYNNKDLTNVTTDTDTGLPVLMAPAKAENLTAGTAAYVNGELIIGTGSDNKSYYNLGYLDGFNKVMDSATIEYQYHKHIDADGNPITASTTASISGGCLTSGSHVHENGCMSTCTIIATCTNSYQGESGNWCNTFEYKHSSCGQGTTSGSSWQTYSKKGQTYTDTHTYYSCNNLPINTYSVGCGKTENSVDSATIIFK